MSQAVLTFRSCLCFLGSLVGFLAHWETLRTIEKVEEAKKEGWRHRQAVHLSETGLRQQL